LPRALCPASYSAEGFTNTFGAEAQAVQVITVRLDIAKSWFQAHGVNHRGQVVLRKKLARS
jgi:hypothetical protein